MTIINFGMGSPNAAIIWTCLVPYSESLPVSGQVRRYRQEEPDRRPDSAYRGHPWRRTSNDYYPPEVPALPAFMLQRAVSSAIRDHSRDYWTGTVYTTNRRIWEHDEEFKKYLLKTRAMAVDMENGDFVHHRICQPHSYGCPAARVRPAHDSGRREKRSRVTAMVTKEFRA